MKYLLPLCALFVPVAAHAASFREITEDIVSLVNNSLVPLIYALAFLVFLVGMTRYFFLEQGEEGREKGKQLMLWGLIGFVVMFSVWGLVNLLLGTFGVAGA
ncbi:MAG TPA: hypothetical protein PK609_01200 [Candidatus Paceibacterota bacterium]|nr:hypothetical protein [Candidatus Paceibacterota bacterium]